MREAKKLADEAEEARDKAAREVVAPLRRMRLSGDLVIEAVVDDIASQKRRRDTS